MKTLKSAKARRSKSQLTNSQRVLQEQVFFAAPQIEAAVVLVRWINTFRVEHELKLGNPSRAESWRFDDIVHLRLGDHLHDIFDLPLDLADPALLQAANLLVHLLQQAIIRNNVPLELHLFGVVVVDRREGILHTFGHIDRELDGACEVGLHDLETDE